MTTRYADDATLARIAELEAENARLKAERDEFYTEYRMACDKGEKDTTARLLAAQLRIKELREALEDVALNPSESAYWLFGVEQALAAPRITLDLSSAPPQLPQREGWQWVPVAWATELKDGEIGFWPTREEACSYCEDGVFPTPLYAAHKPEDVK